MREKRRDHLSLLASGCKTLAKQGSFAAVLLLSLHGSLESQTRNRTRVEPTGRAAEARRTASVGGNRSQSTAFWNARSARRARISVMNHYRTEETAALKRCGDHWKIIHSLLTGCQKRPARRRRSCGPAATRPPPHPPHHRQKAPSRPRCAPWRPATQERLY